MHWLAAAVIGGVALHERSLLPLIAGLVCVAIVIVVGWFFD